jgi:predicted nucleic acid-binding protein
MTLPLYSLDTDTARFISKGRPPEVEARLADIPPARVCVSAFTQAELMYGLERIAPDHRLQLGVRAFLEVVRVLAWGADAADRGAVDAGQVVWAVGRLRKRFLSAFICVHLWLYCPDPECGSATEAF